MNRRTFIQLGVGSGSAALTSGPVSLAAAPNPLLKYLCPPDDLPPDLAQPSPPAPSFVTPLFIPPVMDPVSHLDPAPDPKAHQHYERLRPKKFYITHEVQLNDWVYNTQGTYAKGSYSWGYQSGRHAASTPGPTYHARYGEPILVRRFNDLPTIGYGKVTWALPSTTSHLHNGHTASESDGNPQDWIDSGEFWDHHYGNFPSGNDPREKLSTLWYHDHRLDFTAANVYAGLDGFYNLYDEQDTGFETEADVKRFIENENRQGDPALAEQYEAALQNGDSWMLPSGEFEIPLMLHDIMFFNSEATGRTEVRWNAWNTDGILGDMYTVNRKIRPFLPVKGRKYRFRIINGGPSRFYQIAFFKRGDRSHKKIPFTILTGDGNMLPEPIRVEQVYLSVAQRIDVIIDFGDADWFSENDEIVMVNLLEQINGKGPSGRVLEPDPKADYGTAPEPGTPAQGIMCFRVGARVPDPSRVPERLRELPDIDLSQVKQERLWTFDYDGGLWTINGMVMEPNRIDAGIEMNSDEIWTFRNTGNDWSHPIHCHFTEFLILEINGKPFNPKYIQTEGDESSLEDYLSIPSNKRPVVSLFMGGPRRDVATILPYDEMRVFLRFRDFIGKHVMHCHNVVHEDHAMMIRWDMLPKGQTGFLGSKPAEEVYGKPPHWDPQYPDPRPPAGDHLEERPGQATFQRG